MVKIGEKTAEILETRETGFFVKTRRNGTFTRTVIIMRTDIKQSAFLHILISNSLLTLPISTTISNL